MGGSFNAPIHPTQYALGSMEISYIFLTTPISFNGTAILHALASQHKVQSRLQVLRVAINQGTVGKEPETINNSFDVPD